MRMIDYPYHFSIILHNLTSFENNQSMIEDECWVTKCNPNCWGSMCNCIGSIK